MSLKQLTVFVENKQGAIVDITDALAQNHVDLRALSIADTTDFGILRLVVDKPYEAEDILKAAGLTVSLTDVIAIGIPDRPGGFAETITAVANKAVAVEYMYAFISREQDRAYLIMRVADNETAIAALKAQGCDLLDGESVYQL
jgi:hypothetical protein